MPAPELRLHHETSLERQVWQHFASSSRTRPDA